MANAAYATNTSNSRLYWAVTPNSGNESVIVGGFVSGNATTNVHYKTVYMSGSNYLTGALGNGMGSTATSKIGGWSVSVGFSNIANC